MRDLSLLIAGPAGAGIETVEAMLVRALKGAGFYLFATKEYMSRIRGGSNSIEIRVADRPVRAFSGRADVTVSLAPGAVDRFRERFHPETLLLGPRAFFPEELCSRCRLYEVPFQGLAESAGGELYANTVVLGVLSGLFGLDPEREEEVIRDQFASKGEKILAGNLKAFEKGFEEGKAIREEGGLELPAPDPFATSPWVLSGAQAVALGALAGGCNFLAFYPMSPGTSVALNLAKLSEDFDVIIEQAEDEIAAANMALGAWYAGARAMVTTSGGGFALMVEALSLSGMTEMPMVIHLGQRPGPATGMPTRTEQGDLLFLLHAGHGEFPRVILSPGGIEEAFYLAQRAFDLADRYQVPVILLTDQYLLDFYYNLEPLEVRPPSGPFIIKTDPSYRRYEITPLGISPRGIPGWGEGLVMVDSDEHGPEGRITEDFGVRREMVMKRLRKGEALKGELVEPELYGPEGYRILLVGWGSTLYPVREAMDALGRTDMAFLHIKQVWPLSDLIAEYGKAAEVLGVVEGNATGQLSRVLSAEFGLRPSKRILKFDGLPFSVQELREAFGRL